MTAGRLQRTLDSIRRLFSRDSPGGNGRGDQGGVYERIEERERRAIESLADRKEREADSYERRAREEHSLEYMALAKRSREEAGFLRRMRSEGTEHADLLRALGL